MKLLVGVLLMLIQASSAEGGKTKFTFAGIGTVNFNRSSEIEPPGSPDVSPPKSFLFPRRDCSDIKAVNSSAQDGVYTITPSVGSGPINVYCDMTNNGGGWTVLQRRKDGSEDFIRTWEDYKHGFGSLEDEFWLGNENIYRITNQRGYSIRFDLEHFTKGKKYALYYHFFIDGEDEKYRLHISSYLGDAGDAFVLRHNGQPFSTKDQDNDSWSGHCSQKFLGGWWYKDCHNANLNGQYNNTGVARGLNWSPLTGFHVSLKYTSMKIRP